MHEKLGCLISWAWEMAAASMLSSMRMPGTLWSRAHVRRLLLSLKSSCLYSFCVSCLSSHLFSLHSKLSHHHLQQLACTGHEVSHAPETWSGGDPWVGQLTSAASAASRRRSIFLRPPLGRPDGGRPRLRGLSSGSGGSGAASAWASAGTACTVGGVMPVGIWKASIPACSSSVCLWTMW